MNCIDFFDRGWQLWPDRPCLVDGHTGVEHTYREVGQLTVRIAGTLRDRGYGIGGKAGVLSLNDSLAYTVVLGIMRSGATWLSINARNAAPDIGRQLAHLDCEVLFYQRAFAGHLAEIRANAPAITEFVCLDGRADDTAAPAPALDDWLTTAEADRVELPPDPSRIFAIQTTGGTTGLPKGVVLTNRYLESLAAAQLACMPCPVPPVYLAAAPMTHAAGLFMPYVLAQGGTAVIHSTVDADAILDAIPRHRVTHLFLPPTAIYGLLSRPGVRTGDYSSLRYFVYGASPMAPEKIAESMAIFGPVLCQMYGQTETGFPITYLSAADHFVDGDIASGRFAHSDRLGSCGRATPLARVEIMDDDGRLVENGRIGEIVVRSSGVTPGYHLDPEATAAIRRNGWHLTGDLGVRDEQGYISIVDRKRDMIISGGFNVYSAEVERTIVSHPGVAECAVVGTPDPKWGEVVTAVVERRPGPEVSAEEIIARCREQLGPVKSPKRVDFVGVLPRSPVGKVLKREIRAGYWAHRNRKVN